MDFTNALQMRNNTRVRSLVLDEIARSAVSNILYDANRTATMGKNTLVFTAGLYFYYNDNLKAGGGKVNFETSLEEDDIIVPKVKKILEELGYIVENHDHKSLKLTW